MDTCIWVDHFRHGDPQLHHLLTQGNVLCHPFVIGELAMGSLQRREAILTDLKDLPQAAVAMNDEVLHLASTGRLFGLGIGYIDVHLLASVRLTPGSLFWTRDKRLHDVARKLSLTFVPKLT